jgi:hypothetical protein
MSWAGIGKSGNRGKGKENVKSLYLAIETYGEVGVNLHAFLTLEPY